uniref:Uncharacterized protein n=1 Tax=Branchiostoma floridae TaxID=7739 RepID=C3YHF9_BRAFL|eukprot:XP_002604384.1 hypothetical protein BRAFLDRAFT_73370 [Branchiostoma floridae]
MTKKALSDRLKHMLHWTKESLHWCIRNQRVEELNLQETGSEPMHDLCNYTYNILNLESYHREKRNMTQESLTGDLEETLNPVLEEQQAGMSCIPAIRNVYLKDLRFGFRYRHTSDTCTLQIQVRFGYRKMTTSDLLRECLQLVRGVLKEGEDKTKLEHLKLKRILQKTQVGCHGNREGRGHIQYIRVLLGAD